MAEHVRTQIRHRAARLLEQVGATDGRIQNNRQVAAPKDEALRLTIRTPLEIARTATQDGEIDRRIRMRVEVTGRGGNEDDLADRLDVAAVQIEKLIACEPTFGGLVFDTEYVGAELQIDASNDRFTGGLAVTFDLTVLTRIGEPTASL